MKEQTRLHIMNGVLERHWAVAEAARLLGVSERHAWRLLAAYRKEGAAALAHGNRGRLPPNTTSSAVRARVVMLAGERYRGVNHTHFTELLAEREEIFLSRSTIRRLLVSAGLTSPRHRQLPRHRCRRERMSQEGMLVQIDGSHHQWLGENCPWLTLLLAIDDATGTVPYALFREQEDTEGYFRLMKGIIQRRGIPLALYSDRYFVFCYSKRGESGDVSVIDRSKPTQFGRAMQELGVAQIFAQSPEAKGRIERANGTFQDRLVSELRLAGAGTIDEANAALEAFLPRFNERFGVPAARQELGYRPVDLSLDIDAALCFKEKRRVARDNTVQYYGKTLQIFPGTERRSYARTRVEVQERLNGRLVVCYHGKVLNPEEAPPPAIYLREQAPCIPEDASLMEEPELPKNSVYTEAATRGKIWYEDSEMRRAHRELVKAGMERPRQLRKRIGRPRVSERPDFTRRFQAVADRIALGLESRRQAAKELAIGYATLKRLLDASNQSTPPIEKAYTEVLH